MPPAPAEAMGVSHRHVDASRGIRGYLDVPTLVHGGSESNSSTQICGAAFADTDPAFSPARGVCGRLAGSGSGVPADLLRPPREEVPRPRIYQTPTSPQASVRTACVAKRFPPKRAFCYTYIACNDRARSTTRGCTRSHGSGARTSPATPSEQSKICGDRET